VTVLSRTVAAVAGLVAVAATLAPGPAATARASGHADEGPVTTVTVDPGRDSVAALATYARLMALPAVATGKVPRARAPREGGGEACPASRCRDYELTVPRRVKVSGSQVRVLLPTGYHHRRNAKRRYPVVFLWNGGLSRADGWTFKTELTRMSRRWPAILVMPEGGRGKEAGFFTDWKDGSFDWETFHTKVVVPWVDKTFRTIPGARAAVGASMGGIGVVNYAAHNPGMFKAILSISGALDTTAMATTALDPTLGAILGHTEPDLRRIWGDPVRDRANWDAHNPTKLVPRLKGVRVFVTSGTGSLDVGSEGVYNGTFENELWNTQRSFFYALTAHRIPYSARIMIGGVHDWPWFNHPLRWAMPQLIRAARR
jgi:S-formylglutathione hydrolase FrmB